MNLKSFLKSAMLGVVVIGLGVTAGRAAEGKGEAQTKTGTVKKVEVDAKQVVVMVTRELTFTVTDTTKILKNKEPKRLADIKVDDKVSVEYVKEGEARNAKKIVILAE